MLVEEERGAVQADRGLPGARPALHHQAGVEWGADDHVLLGRDRRHDVAHRPGAGALQLREQRVGDAAHVRVGGVHRVGVVEDLVEEVVELDAGHQEPPPPAQPEGVVRGGPVEGRRHRRPPVDDDGVAAVVLHMAAADVPGVAVLVVEPPEAEPGHVGREAAEPMVEVGLGDGGVHLLRGVVRDGDRRSRPVPHRGEAGVRAPQDRPLAVQVGVGFDEVGWQWPS